MDERDLKTTDSDHIYNWGNWGLKMIKWIDQWHVNSGDMKKHTN